MPETNEEPNFAYVFIGADVKPESRPEKEANHDAMAATIIRPMAL